MLDHDNTGPILQLYFSRQVLLDYNCIYSGMAHHEKFSVNFKDKYLT